MQSAFQGARWGFSVNLFKREAVKKKKQFYYSIGCWRQHFGTNPHQTFVQVKNASQHRMGRTEWCEVFSLKMGASLKVCLFRKAKKIQHKC